MRMLLIQFEAWEFRDPARTEDDDDAAYERSIFFNEFLGFTVGWDFNSRASKTRKLDLSMLQKI